MKLSEEKLVSYLETENIDAFYIHNSVNVRYICKYSGGDAYLLILRHSSSQNDEPKFYLLTDPRCLEHAESECPEYTCIDWRPYGSIAKCLGAVTRQEHIQTMAVESGTLPLSMYEEIQEECESRLLPRLGVIEDLQIVKESNELQCIRTACEISSRALEKLYRDIRPGITEKELEARLTMYMAMEDADVKSSANIVLSGARTSMLHGVPSMKAVEYGDLVLIDFGCKYHGYTADITRTVIAGKATAKQKEIYQLVLDINEACIANMKAGIRADSLYQIAMNMIKGTGYESYFYTSFGHGIGLFVHQRPFVREQSEDILEENVVMTMEPGIYIPGWGGIRIEDDLLIKNDGCINLALPDKQLLELF